MKKEEDWNVRETAEIVEGTVDRIVFQAPEGTYSVLSLKVKNGGRVTVTLNSEPPNLGAEVRFRGAFIIHPRFGEQFRASGIELLRPTDTAGIERFLASGILKGVGASQARRIVETFGADSLDIIEHSPNKLLEIRGIGKSTVKKIVESYAKNSELRDIMLWLETHGVSGMLAARIYKRYGSLSIEVLENHPYQLAYDVYGIGFLTADAIAQSTGIDLEDEERIRAGVNYALSDISNSGHTCAPVEYLIKESVKILRIENVELVADVIERMIEAEEVLSEKIKQNDYVYSRYLYESEVIVAARINDIKKLAAYFKVNNIDAFISNWELNSGINLAKKQKDAIKYAMDSGVFVLTGGPGTGKTTVIRGIIELLESLSCEILLGAPTGRAAKRLTETTGREAKTVHRLLEAQAIDGGGFEFGRDEDNPLDADVVILDEVSMMDINLMRSFLLAIPNGAHIILVGDVDQLPAVGPGLVLKDIIASKVGTSVALTEIFRQNEESTIVVAAHEINNGKMPDIKDSKDFEFIELEDSEAVADAIEVFMTKVLPSEGYSPLTDIQVLSPMHKDICGTMKLNSRLQLALNPPESGKNERNFGNIVLRENDKVMQIRNNYEKKVFNGDVGFIAEITDEFIKVIFDSEVEAIYVKDEISDLALAYCMSVHKSQGSEYPVIILPLVKSHFIMHQRNLLYTAVTRAKERVYLFGDLKSFQYAIKNNRTAKRYSLLKERLMGIIK